MSASQGSLNNYGAGSDGMFYYYKQEKSCGTSKCGRPCHLGPNLQMLKITKFEKPMECKAWCKKCEVFVDGVEVEECK